MQIPQPLFYAVASLLNDVFLFFGGGDRPEDGSIGLLGIAGRLEDFLFVGGGGSRMGRWPDGVVGGCGFGWACGSYVVAPPTDLGKSDKTVMTSEVDAIILSWCPKLSFGRLGACFGTLGDDFGSLGHLGAAEGTPWGPVLDFERFGVGFGTQV